MVSLFKVDCDRPRRTLAEQSIPYHPSNRLPNSMQYAPHRRSQKAPLLITHHLPTHHLPLCHTSPHYTLTTSHPHHILVPLTVQTMCHKTIEWCYRCGYIKPVRVALQCHGKRWARCRSATEIKRLNARCLNCVIAGERGTIWRLLTGTVGEIAGGGGGEWLQRGRQQAEGASRWRCAVDRHEPVVAVTCSCDDLREVKGLWVPWSAESC